MNSLILLFVLAAGLIVGGGPSSDTLWMIRAELLVVRLPEQRAIQFQEQLRNANRVSVAQTELLALVQKGEAELVDWPIVTTRSGNRAVSENVREVRYAIEFAPPKDLGLRGVAPGLDSVPTPSAPDAPKPARTKGTPMQTEEGANILAGVPKTFETRNSGVTFELEPVVSWDGKTIDAQLAVAHISLLGYRKEKLETVGRHTLVIEQPEFYTRRVSTNVTLKSGEPHLLSFHKLADPPGMVELMLVTMTQIEAGKWDYPGRAGAPAPEPTKPPASEAK
jgi:hypothetical protein